MNLKGTPHDMEVERREWSISFGDDCAGDVADSFVSENCQYFYKENGFWIMSNDQLHWHRITDPRFAAQIQKWTEMNGAVPETMELEARNHEANATPTARKIAREHGLDLSKITGTGKGGKIVLRDMKVAYAASCGEAFALARREEAERSGVIYVTAQWYAVTPWGKKAILSGPFLRAVGLEPATQRNYWQLKGTGYDEDDRDNEGQA